MMTAGLHQRAASLQRGSAQVRPGQEAQPSLCRCERNSPILPMHACFQPLSALHMDVLLSRRAVPVAAANQLPSSLRQAAHSAHLRARCEQALWWCKVFPLSRQADIDMSGICGTRV